MSVSNLQLDTLRIVDMNKAYNNSPSKEVLCFRHLAKQAIRKLFDDDGFIEIDTPFLITANTPDPFIDPFFVLEKHGGLGQRQLHTSPEIWLKRSLSLGLEKIYHMARVFRDDPPSDHHSAEFTMLEWYRVNTRLVDMLTDCEAIFNLSAKIAQKQGQMEPGPDLTILKTDVSFLFKKFARIDLEHELHRIAQGDHLSLNRALAERRTEHLPQDASFADAFFHIMLKYVEPNLPKNQPVAIFGWPVQLAALAAPSEQNPLLCDRFEIYFQGLEIANAYQECTQADVLRGRFVSENLERAALSKPVFPIDEDLLVGVSKMPETAGIALGLDRLFMALLSKKQISQIILVID